MAGMVNGCLGIIQLEAKPSQMELKVQQDQLELAWELIFMLEVEVLAALAQLLKMQGRGEAVDYMVAVAAEEDVVDGIPVQERQHKLIHLEREEMERKVL
jgi:hypothetical protein